jgi:hypothetical protein
LILVGRGTYLDIFAYSIIWGNCVSSTHVNFQITSDEIARVRRVVNGKDDAFGQWGAASSDDTVVSLTADPVFFSKKITLDNPCTIHLIYMAVVLSFLCINFFDCIL